MVSVNVTNLHEFVLKIDAFTEDVPEKILDVKKTLGLKAIELIIPRTPVGNPDLWKPTSLPAPPGYVGGRARANWQVTFDTPFLGQLEVIDSSEGGSNTVGQGSMKILNDKDPFGTIWISNNLPYIQRLEDGWSTQSPPQGMFAATVNDLQAGI